MDVYEAIAARKTVRDFAPREINRALLQNIVAAGLQAPTHDHLRTWHFVLLQDKARRKALLDVLVHPLDEAGTVQVIDEWGLTDPLQRAMYLDAVPKQYGMLFSAGCLLLPCFKQTGPLLKPKELSSLNAFASVWCCIENMLLAAAAEGIFGVTRIPFDGERQTLKRFLKIPEEYEIPCYLALGYPAGHARRTRQVAVSPLERVHVDGW